MAEHDDDLPNDWSGYPSPDAYFEDLADMAGNSPEGVRVRLAQVRRDAAREALDGLARDCEQIAENVMTEAARNRWDHTAHVIRETLAIEHPEETP